MKPIEPTLKEHWLSFDATCPFYGRMFIVSFALLVARAAYGIAFFEYKSIIAVAGLDSFFWLCLWVFVIALGFIIGSLEDVIYERAKMLAADRLRNAYGQAH